MTPMMPVTQMPANDASQLPAIYFGTPSRNPPGGGSAGGGKRTGGKPAKPAPKKGGGKKTPKKR
jgi:hypothetical protein